MKRSKERDRESEKAPQPDKLEVICPLIFSLTNLAVNYDLTWQPETKLMVADDDGFTTVDVTGVWKSNPVQRGHTNAFQSELTKMREDKTISWDESAYYFTHEEGVEARKLYEKRVLDGELKAHIASWGPNPARADDKSRFHKFTGVTFEELKKKFPELYGKKSDPRPRTDETKEIVVGEGKVEEVISTETSNEEPTNAELVQIDEEAKVAAAVATDETLEDLLRADSSSEDDQDDHTVIVLTVPGDIATERIDVSHESVCWRSDDGREDMQAYLHVLPELDTEMWLGEGEWTINGQKYIVKVDR